MSQEKMDNSAKNAFQILIAVSVGVISYILMSIIMMPVDTPVGVITALVIANGLVMPFAVLLWRNIPGEKFASLVISVVTFFVTGLVMNYFSSPFLFSAIVIIIGPLCFGLVRYWISRRK